MGKVRVVGTGLSGLVGSRVAEMLSSRYEFANLSLETGVDILNKKVVQIIADLQADVVLHLAAKTDVDGCEKDRELGKRGEAWRVNVVGTKNIIEGCQRSGKRFVYISTDFVFDGKKEEPYVEDDVPNPINWYGRTKYEGEKIVQNFHTDWVIVRIAYPYRTSFERKDFVRSLIQRFKEGKSLMMVSDHTMTPTFIDDIAYALDAIIQTRASGIFHVVGSQHISPYEAAILIADAFGFDRSLVGKTTREKFFKNRATRPSYLAISNDKIRQLGIAMRTFKEGIKAVKEQMEGTRSSVSS